MNCAATKEIYFFTSSDKNVNLILFYSNQRNEPASTFDIITILITLTSNDGLGDSGTDSPNPSLLAYKRYGCK